MDARYFNRELSWLEFNARVLDESLNSNNPLLERVKFAGIVSSNLDEFVMVRFAGIKRQIRDNRDSTCPTGLSPRKQVTQIRKKISHIVDVQQRHIAGTLFPELARNNVHILRRGEFSQSQERHIRDYFRREIFPVLTPLRIDQAMPFVNNLTLYILFELEPLEDVQDTVPMRNGEETAFRKAILPLPRNTERLVQIPGESNELNFTFLEDVIIICATDLFPGNTIVRSLVWRMTRDADLGVDEERDEDFLTAMEEVLVDRQTSFPVRLQTETPKDDGHRHLIEELKSALDLDDEDHFETKTMIDCSVLIDLPFRIDAPSLFYPTHTPIVPSAFQSEDDIFSVISESDHLLHHPYESFEPVIKLLQDSTSDPNVLAIKMTLYRTSGDTPIVKALVAACEAGKQVTVLVELKARFDEERNITWAQELEKAGAIVVYGIAHLKVHAKALMIVRRELQGIRRYVHMSTGNYNEKTARLYSDIGFLSSRDDIASDVSLFFNAITGYSSVPKLRQLFMAPTGLKRRIIDLIHREIERIKATGRGLIMIKLNSLADVDVIESLYEASNAGVEIRMTIRGVCMLVPGVKGQSENIQVVSLVDQFLEHSRIVYFLNGGDEELYLSSADWMPRNLERRVELMFPVVDAENCERLKHILSCYFSDTTHAQELHSDGSYHRIRPEEDNVPLRAQWLLQSEAETRAEPLDEQSRKEFSVRRTPFH